MRRVVGHIPNERRPCFYARQRPNISFATYFLAPTRYDLRAPAFAPSLRVAAKPRASTDSNSVFTLVANSGR